MLRNMMKSKIHQATVTEANLQYEGSITVDVDLLKAADILAGERVQVVNLMNGSRIETYCLEGPSGSGTICLNGGAARWAQVGDKIILISYALVETEEARRMKRKVVFVDAANRIRLPKTVGERPPRTRGGWIREEKVAAEDVGRSPWSTSA